MGKLTELNVPESISLKRVIGECLRHHRGLGTGHVLIGVARELGISDCVLACNNRMVFRYINDQALQALC